MVKHIERFDNLLDLVEYFLKTEATDLPLFKIILEDHFEVYKCENKNPTFAVPPFIKVIYDTISGHTYLISDVHESMGEINNIQLMLLYNLNTNEWFYIDHPIYKEVN